MPDKPKAPKSKIKVEEIEDTPQEPEVVETPVEEPKVEETPTALPSDLPKVSSFSQLDSDEKLDTSEEAKPSSDTPEEEKTEEVSEETNALSETETPMSSEDVKEWLKEVRPDTSKEIVKSGGPNFKIILVIMLFLGMIGAIVGGVIYYKRGVNPSETPSENQEPQTATETPAASPTVTPAAVDLSKLSVNIQNGTGVPGVAAKTKTLIVAVGFVDSKVTTGNADANNYESTEIRLKSSTPDSVYTTLEKALTGSYTVVKSDKALDDKSTYDVIVIVGKAK